MNHTTETLFQKLGGRPAVTVVVDLFYDKVLADPLLADFFSETDMAQQKRHQTAFVAMALGGPNEYQGRAMGDAHTGLGIEDMHFDAVAGHLSAALAQAGVGEEDIATIIGTVATLREAVVGA